MQQSGTKDDDEKLMVDLVDPLFILEVAKVLTFGAKKYGPHNWRKGLKYTRVYSALQRHLLAWAAGESTDPESGINHLSHAACNIMFLRCLPNMFDDRWKNIQTGQGFADRMRECMGRRDNKITGEI